MFVDINTIHLTSIVVANIAEVISSAIMSLSDCTKN